MANSFSVAPGVYYTERDATLATKSGLSMSAGFVGRFQWGPVEQVVNITGGETECVSIFYKPSQNKIGVDQLVLHDYFAYSNSAQTVRAFSVGAKNAVASGDADTTIKNKNELEAYNGTVKQFAKYPGALGNNIGLYVMDEATRLSIKEEFELGFRSGASILWQSATDKAALSASEYNVFVTDTSGALSGITPPSELDRKSLKLVLTGGVAKPELVLGTSSFPITLTFSGGVEPTDEAELITDLVSQFVDISPTEKARNNIRAIKLSGVDTIEVEFIESVPADGTWFVDSATAFTTITEESIIVESVGSILGYYPRVSTVEGSVNNNTGLPNHFTETVNVNSNYIGLGPSWETPTIGLTKLQGGSDGDVDNTDFFTSIQLLNSSTIPMLGYIDVSYDLGSQQQGIDLSLKRRNSVTFVSPLIDLRSRTNANAKYNYLRSWSQDLLRDNSYFFKLDNWAEVYDPYNKRYRFIPTSGGTCGLWFRSISKVGTGKSPAFLNRGKYLNYRKLDWTADDDQVAVLYNDFSINSVRSMAEGNILWGDRTGLSKDSAFNRINTRGVFIDCETAIATTAKYTLGENNDTFTRTLFDNAVVPFLRAKKEAGEIEDFMVKTDETNNTGQVIVSNQFVSGIFIKPKYSINFIYLDFVAVRPDVQFSEVENLG